MRIMYVEDNQANASLLQRVASAGQHEFYNYIDAESALDHYMEVQPDIVFVDIQLAGVMNGLEFVQALRMGKIAVPIVAISAFANENERGLYINAGCDELLVKPTSPNQILHLLESL